MPGGRGKKKAPVTAQSLNSAASTGSRTPEPQQQIVHPATAATAAAPPPAKSVSSSSNKSAQVR